MRVVLFDLGNTLIDNHHNLLPGAEEMLNAAQSLVLQRIQTPSREEHGPGGRFCFSVQLIVSFHHPLPTEVRITTSNLLRRFAVVNPTCSIQSLPLHSLVHRIMMCADKARG